MQESPVLPGCLFILCGTFKNRASERNSFEIGSCARKLIGHADPKTARVHNNRELKFLQPTANIAASDPYCQLYDATGVRLRGGR